jgi:hypothetical protein
MLCLLSSCIPHQPSLSNAVPIPPHVIRIQSYPRLRFGHRYRLIVNTPATDNCSNIAGAEVPRYVVSEALPQYTAWTDDSSFPHG